MNFGCKIERCGNSYLCLTDLLFHVLPLFPLALILFCLPVMDGKSWQLLPPALLFCMKAMLGLSKSPDLILFIFPVFSHIACRFLHSQRCGILCKGFCSCHWTIPHLPTFLQFSPLSLVDHDQQMVLLTLLWLQPLFKLCWWWGTAKSALINKDKQGVCCSVKMCKTKLDPRKQPFFFLPKTLWGLPRTVEHGNFTAFLSPHEEYWLWPAFFNINTTLCVYD